MSLFDSASIVVTPNAYKASKLYAIKPTDGSGDLTVTRATTARRFNSAGLIESVAVNVPRLDYTNSSCPSILVEPQRTNLALYSERFDNAAWIKLRGSISANSTISPDGTQNADLFVPTAINDNHTIYTTISNGQRVFSVYAKADGFNYVFLGVNNNVASDGVFFDLSNGTISQNTSSLTASIKSVGNGWYRCDAYSNTWGTIAVISTSENGTSIVHNGDGTSGIYLWGAQLEAGSYATSYVPTLASAVTRNADVISKTGISSLIGQTEGTMFADVNVKNLGIPTRQIFNLTNGTPNFVNLSFLNTNVLRVTIRANGGTQYNVSTSALPIGRYKLAATYKAGELKLYVNGVLIGTNTNASVSWSSALDRLNLDNSVLGGENFSDGINLVSHWKTVLTNEECINLTTI